MSKLDDDSRTNNIPTYDDLIQINSQLNTSIEKLVSLCYGICVFSFSKKSYTPLEHEEQIFVRTLLHMAGIIEDFNDLIGVDIIDEWLKVGTPILGDVIIYSIDGNPLNTSIKLCINDRMYLGLKDMNYTFRCHLGSNYVMLEPEVEYIERLKNILHILRHK